MSGIWYILPSCVSGSLCVIGSTAFCSLMVSFLISLTFSFVDFECFVDDTTGTTLSSLIIGTVGGGGDSINSLLKF